MSAYISRISKDLPGKFSARHVWMIQLVDGKWELATEETPNAIEGTGVWRTE